MAVAPDAVTPRDNVVLSIKIGLDLDRHCRAERRMRHFICARPLNANWPAARRARQQNGIERNIIGCVMAVATGAFHVLDRNILDRQSQHQREISAQEIDALTVRPDVHTLAVPLRHGARGRD